MEEEEEEEEGHGCRPQIWIPETEYYPKMSSHAEIRTPVLVTINLSLSLA